MITIKQSELKKSSPTDNMGRNSFYTKLDEKQNIFICLFLTTFNTDSLNI